MELLEEELHENREKSKTREKLAFGMQSVEHRGKKRMAVMIMCSKPKKQPLQTEVEQRTPALFLRKKNNTHTRTQWGAILPVALNPLRGDLHLWQK